MSDIDFTQFRSILSIQKETLDTGNFLIWHVISIHSLYTERNVTLLTQLRINVLFQSILSIQKETKIRHLVVDLSTISIHSLYTERNSLHLYYNEYIFISIHSLYTERNGREDGAALSFGVFQSILSIQKETKAFVVVFKSIKISIHSLYTERNRLNHLCTLYCHISIHSLYTERNTLLSSLFLQLLHFNPFSLYRKKQQAANAFAFNRLFQSILSIQKETRIQRFEPRAY